MGWERQANTSICQKLISQNAVVIWLFFAVSSSIFFQSKALANDKPVKSEFEYMKKVKRGTHLLKALGDEKTSIDDVISVTLDQKVIGKFKVLEVKDDNLFCEYNGETLLEGRLKDYRFQNLGKQAPGLAAALITPDPTLEKAQRPQIEIITGGTGGKNHLLDLALANKIEKRQNSLDIGLRYSLPEFEPAKWLNWFYGGVTVNVHTLTEAQTVAQRPQSESTTYDIQDTSRSIRYQAGIQIPTTIPLFSIIDIYGILLDERHSILLTKQFSQEDDLATLRSDETGLGAATTLRVLKGLNLQFFFETSVSKTISMTSEERVLEDTKGTGKRSAFGFRPSYTTGIWNFKPRLFLKVELGLVLQSAKYQMTGQESRREFSPSYFDFKPEAALISSLSF